MGKRKKERSNSSIRRKIRRLQQKIRPSTSEDDEVYGRSYSRSPTPESRRLSLYSEGSEVVEVISPPETTESAEIGATSDLPPDLDRPDQASDIGLPVEILEAIGHPTGKEEILGPPINEELSKRWGRVLVEGLTSEVKVATLKNILTPENFTLSKAPKLNLEILSVVSDSIKHRDKLLEKAQNQLGLGIAGLTNITTALIKEDLPKIEIIRKLSEVSQVFLDLHYENTLHRRKLITSSLDRKFSSTINEVKRDSLLFGSELGEKIKATKTAEKSGLQIKRNTINLPSTSRQQGNWRGPPRYQQYQSTKVTKPGGPKMRYPPIQRHSTQARRPPAASRSAPTRKTDYRSRRIQ